MQVFFRLRSTVYETQMGTIQNSPTDCTAETAAWGFTQGRQLSSEARVRYAPSVVRTRPEPLGVPGT